MKKMARRFLIIFSLIVLAFIFLEACSKNPATAQQNTFINPNSDLGKYSLNAAELQDLYLVSQSNLDKDKLNPNAVSGYAANFDNKVKNTSSPNYKSVSINLQAYNSAEDAKKDFSRDMLPKEVLKNFQEIKLNSTIGDESFTYSRTAMGQRRLYVLYRTKNAVVQLNSIGIGTNSTVRYARLMESKI